MLKVEDKVKVREDLKCGEEYGKYTFSDAMDEFRGKIATIKHIDEECDEIYRNYNLDIDNLRFCWTEEMFEKKNNETKELTFKEVITNIKEGEIWKNENYIIKYLHGTISIKTKNGEVFNGIAFCDDVLFTLQRKQYTFEEAFKSFNNGKEIESCISNFKYRIYNNKTISVTGLTYDKKRLVSKDENNFTVNEVQNKWYIND